MADPDPIEEPPDLDPDFAQVQAPPLEPTDVPAERAGGGAA